MLFLALILGALALVWLFVPASRTWLSGWKTRLLALATAALGLVELLDPMLVSQALGLNDQGRAVATIVIGATMLILREITSKPGRLVRDK